MKTGIKTLFRNIKYTFDYPDLAAGLTYPETFPETGLPSWFIGMKLRSLTKLVRTHSALPRLNEIHNTPHPLALKVWRNLLQYNPNNIGNWTADAPDWMDGTQKTERLLIHAIIDLYGGDIREWEGHITGGGSESNLYSLWLSRNSLRKDHTGSRICILHNDLTHYSIAKYANLLDVPLVPVRLDSQTWSYHIGSLERTVTAAANRGTGRFILPLTYGYAQTGTNDDYARISEAVAGLERRLGVGFSIFADAALNGLVLPFTGAKFTPLRERHLDAVNVDFHKFGMVPLPCGLALYRKRLRRNIELDVPFLPRHDTTLAGSRSGVAPAAAYFVMMALGKGGFSRLAAKSVEMKRKFLRQAVKQVPGITIIDDPFGITIGLVSPRPLPQNFRDSYGLYTKAATYHFADGDRRLYIYKATFIAKT